VILIDTNVLLTAASTRAERHERAQQWLDERLSSGMRVGMPWHSLLGFVRLITNRSVSDTKITVPDSWQTVRAWLSLPNVWIPQPTERHADIIGDLIASANVGTRDVMDLHLAALAIEHGLTLCSADTGFVRFKALQWMNPLD
jgi:toxin-antitoxin system PIN domain toxin